MQLTKALLKYLESVGDPTDTRTDREKFEAAGVSAATAWRAKRDPVCVDIIRKATDLLGPTARPEALQCLVRNFRKGDRASARDYLQYTGDIGSGTTVVTNVVTGDLADKIKDIEEEDRAATAAATVKRT